MSAGYIFVSQASSYLNADKVFSQQVHCSRHRFRYLSLNQDPVLESEDNEDWERDISLTCRPALIKAELLRVLEVASDSTHFTEVVKHD